MGETVAEPAKLAEGYPQKQELAEVPKTAAEEKESAEKKRAAIVARVAAAKAEQEKAQRVVAFQEGKKKEIEEKGATLHFGEHQGITCDACSVVPIFGYRYACKSCSSHDVCESCFDAWAGGTGVMPNKLAKQTLSTNPTDHSFKLYKDQTFKPVVKPAGGASTKSAPKLKPNDNCDCGSGKKYKKCCMNK
eukprot:symbB.v1.2.034279.t1/scaffold4398.1/size40168/6